MPQSLLRVEDPDRDPRLIATGRAAIAAMTCGQFNVLTSTPCGSHRMHIAPSAIHKGASPAPQTPVVPSLSGAILLPILVISNIGISDH